MTMTAPTGGGAGGNLVYVANLPPNIGSTEVRRRVHKKPFGLRVCCNVCVLGVGPNTTQHNTSPSSKQTNE
jgi:hypothetical protein